MISRAVFLRITNVSDGRYRESENGHFMFNKGFFFENRAVYEIMLRNILERGRPQRTVWRMRVACWISKGTHTLSEYLILIAFLYNHGCTNAP